MSTSVHDRIAPYTAFGDRQPVELVLVQTPAGWMWFAQELDGYGITEAFGGPHPAQRAALEEAIAAHPFWQLVRVA